MSLEEMLLYTEVCNKRNIASLARAKKRGLGLITNNQGNQNQFYGKSMLETIDWTDEELEILLKTAKILQKYDIQRRNMSFLKMQQKKQKQR